MEIVVDDDANSARLTEANQKVTEYIEQTFDNVLSELQASPPGRPKIVLRHITSALPPSGPEIRITPWQVNNREIKYSWPGSSATEAWRFACLIKILTQIHAAIVDGVVITKRDIFYHDPSLFKKQETVERYLNDIAFTCGVSRRDLNISASPKGLVCGFSGDHVELTPDISAIHQEKVDPINWILVIEKEATFNVLVEQNLHNSTRFGKGLLVTGKGYPDLNTRRFLRAVLDVAPLPISIFGIFDSDPDGFGIHRCYTSGSQKSSQEMAYNIPELKWIGVNLEDLMAHQSAMDACVPLTARDRACAVAMLNRSFERGGSDVGIELFARRSLQQMLMLDKKAEMQALAEVPGGFTKWLTEKVQPQL